MKFTVEIPYEKDRYSVSGYRRPYVGYSNEKIVSENKGGYQVRGSVTVEFELKVTTWDALIGLDRLSRETQVITTKNVDQVWEIVKGHFNVNKVPSSHYIGVVHKVMALKGWSNMYANFTILDDQRGWGYMGGTGCGSLVHDLTFSKILGVNPKIADTGLRFTLATLLFSSMLGEVKRIREDNKHLRDSVLEDDVFVSLNARPTCQATVAYVGASGYPVRGADASHCSCSKCAVKLGITVNPRRKGIAITTPDVLEYKGLTFTYTKVTKTSAVLKVTAAAGTLVDRKTLNKNINERGGSASYRNEYKDKRIDGIYYVSAIKPAKEGETGLTLKMGRETKDSMFEKAKTLADNGLLLLVK